MFSSTRNSNQAGASQDLIQQKRIAPEQRLLAEAVRLHEDSQGFAINDPQADAQAQKADGDFEQRIVVRAAALSISSALSNSLQQLRSAIGIIIVIGLILAVIAGATAAQMALGSQSEGPAVNFFWVLGSLLGVPSIALALWLILAFLKPQTAAAGSLGSLSFQLGRRIGQWLHKGPMQMAAAQALGSLYTRTDIGRWALSAISHGIWLAFLLSCLVLVLLILSTKQYTFVWETTILSERAYITLTRLIAAIPETLGFSAPDAEQIAASHWAQKVEPSLSAREAWSGLLVGSIVAYGVLPRIVLLGLCLLARWRAEKRFRLDTELPGYVRLQTRLMPASRNIGVVDPDPHKKSEASKHIHSHSEARTIGSVGAAAIMGFEIEQPASAWPPKIRGVDWLDLGLVDSREDRRRVLEQLQSVTVALRSVVIVCSAATTPDRGMRGFITRVRTSSNAPLLLLLTDGQRLRDRGHPDEVQQRFADWRELAEDAQVSEDSVVDLDLDHLTDVSRDRLASLMGAGGGHAPRTQHIEQSFSLILEHLAGWSGVPDANAQAELHRAIAALHKNEHQSWQTLLRPRVDTSTDLVGQLKSSANQMVSLLPERLRRNPKWYAAGALAGAMGCVTAATLFTPAAIATLPMWAGLGAALSLAVNPKNPETGQTETTQADLGDAVSSAALFAILLELQGRDEAQITRIIDQVAGDKEPPIIGNAEAARQWLDTLHHRFERAEAAEGSA